MFEGLRACYWRTSGADETAGSTTTSTKFRDVWHDHFLVVDLCSFANFAFWRDDLKSKESKRTCKSKQPYLLIICDGGNLIPLPRISMESTTTAPASANGSQHHDTTILSVARKLDEENSHIGTIGDDAAINHHPDSPRRQHYSASYKYQIICSILTFSLLAVAIALGAASLQRSNEALALANQAIDNDKDMMTISDSTQWVEEDKDYWTAPAPPITTPSAPISKPTPHPLNPKWFNTEHDKYQSIISSESNVPHHSHILAGLFCHHHNLWLCPYDAYCPNGQGNDPYGGGPPKTNNWDTISQKQWSPFVTLEDATSSVGSEGGTWVQIGSVPETDGGIEGNGYGTCWTWSDWMNGGGGDIEHAVREEHRRWILCCDDPEGG